MAKQKTGELVRFSVHCAITGSQIRGRSGKPLRIIAFTAKAARHQAKLVHSGPVTVQPDTAARATPVNSNGGQL